MALDKGNKKRHKSAYTGFFSYIRRIPSWVMWSVGLAIAAMYIGLFYYFFTGSLSLRWQALYGSVPEPDAQRYPIRGIDISHYQSQIDWSVLNESSISSNLIRFVFVKATEGADSLDNAFENNFYQARNNGYIRGAYHYFKPNVDAAKQAKFYINHVKLEPGDLPPVLDVEEAGKMDKMQLQRAVSCWLYIVETYYGVKPIIYSGFKFKTTFLNESFFKKYPYWIAHYYRSSLDYDDAWSFWQYSDCGVINGINGSVDFDVFNGDMNQLRALTIPNVREEDNNIDTLNSDKYTILHKNDTLK